MDCIRVGESVTAGFGSLVNVVEGINVVELGPRSMFEIVLEAVSGPTNERKGVLLTAEHPLWVPEKGWCPISVEEYLAGDIGTVQPVVVDNEGTLEGVSYSGDESKLLPLLAPIQIGDRVATWNEASSMCVVDILEHPGFTPWTRLYSLVTTRGTGSYIVDPGLTAMGWPDGTFNYERYLLSDLVEV